MSLTTMAGAQIVPEQLALIDPVAVSHQGLVIVLARVQGKPVDTIYFNVRVPMAGTTYDYQNYLGWKALTLWQSGAVVNPLGVPQLLRVAGMSLVTAPPLVTTPTPADAAFRAVSDGKYIYIFRQSVAGTLYMNRFLLLRRSGADPQADQGVPAPDVYELEPAWEVRYQRSGLRDTPSGPRDTLNYRNMTGQPFVEPTAEIVGLPVVSNGSFAVMMTPNADDGSNRWQFVSTSTTSIVVNSFSQQANGGIDFSAASQRTFTVTPLLETAPGVTAPLTLTGGVDCALYGEQEPTDSADPGQGTLKRVARAMIVAPVAAASAGLAAGLAVYDLGVDSQGVLTTPVPQIVSPLLDGSIVNGAFQPLQAATYPVTDNDLTIVGAIPVYAYVLGQVSASGAPRLLDSGDGRVHCYYAGTVSGNNFLVAQYYPLATRASVSLPWTAGSETGTLLFVARQTGTSLSGLVATTSASGANADLCNLDINYGAGAHVGAESWVGVPRDLSEFLAVVNGEAANDPEDAGVVAGQTIYFDYTGSMVQARLPLGSATTPTGYLTLVGLRPDVRMSAATVSVTSGVATLGLSFVVGGVTVTQTWSGLPGDTSQAAVVLRGDAAQQSYYTPGGTDTQVLALNSGAGVMLFFVKSGVSGAGISITVSAPSSGKIDQVNVTVTGGGGPVQLTNVTASVTGLAAALMANAQVASLIAAISPGVESPVSAGAQTQGVVDLRVLSGIFAVLPPSSGDVLVSATVTPGVLQGHSQQAPVVVKPLPNRTVGVMGVAATQPVSGQVGLVQNAASTVVAAPTNGQWLAAQTLYSLQMNEQGAMSVPTAAPSFELLAPGAEMTLEAWVNPADGLPARIFTFNGAPLPAGSVGVQPTYFLGTSGQPCLQYGVYGGTGSQFGSFVQVTSAGSISNFPPQQQFTWEGWAKPAAQVAPGTFGGSVIELLDATNPVLTPLEIGFSQGLVPFVKYNDGSANHTIPASSAVPANEWTHLALTGTQISGSQYQLVFFVNADQVWSQTVTMVWPAQPPLLYLGGSSSAYSDPSMAGSLAEVRVWNDARTLPEIRSTLYTTLTGYEPGLMGYWMLQGSVTSGATMVNSCASTGSGLNGILTITSHQTAVQSTDGTFLSMTVGMGGSAPVLAGAFLRANRWNHVAAIYKAGTGITLDPAQTDCVNCGSSDNLDVATTFSLEAWIQVPAFTSTANTIVSKWGGTPDTQSFWFGFNASGMLSASVMVLPPGEEDPVEYSVTSTSNVADGKPHHVAFTYNSAYDADKEVTNITLILYVDGQPAGTSTQTLDELAAPTQITGTDVVIGASALGTGALDNNEYFKGTLTGVRIWSITLTPKQVLGAMTRGQSYPTSGAISAWWFTEMDGKIATDSVSNNNGKLSRSGLWALFGHLSSLTCVANGTQVGAMQPAPANATTGYPNGTLQFTAGGCFNGSNLVNGFGGQLDELRIWNRALTVGSVRDRRFSPLMGDEPGLVAYWNFDGQNMKDATSNSLDGQGAGPVPPTFVVSDAPVANEGPWVRNVYNGALTDYQVPITGAPALVEFGDVQRERDSTLTASLERGYYLVSGGMTLEPAFRVGDLALTYLGQVQTKPTLLGYIEGAPPVPSENLSRPFYNSTAAPFFNYFGASTVTLTEAESTSYTFTSTTTVGAVKYDINASIGVAVGFKAATTPVVWNEVASEEDSLLAKYKGSEIVGDTQTPMRTSGWTENISDSLSLRGTWEAPQTNPANYVNPVVGRRFLPANQGYALVLSNTADLYAMQMRTTGAMVGSVVVPNLDIPPDKNIITFEIDPNYVSNGTLDGKIGLVNDPLYPDADFKRGSYFNPLQSYLLKAQIERESMELTAYFAQFDVGKAKTKKYDVNYSKELVDAAESKMFVNRTEDTVVRKSMVNTYVWTAAGGLHAEQEQFTDTRQMTYAGFRKEVNTAGLSGSLKALLGPGVGIGPSLSFDYLGGQQVDVTVSKTQADSTGFGLNLQVVGDPILLGWNQTTQSFTSGPCPGKVASYRFNAFYLAPSTENAETFNNIVDANWLRSDDPNAIALREATVSGVPVWRVLYRVTYVSRVPPEFDTAPDQTLAPQYSRSVDPVDDADLMDLIVKQLGGAAVTPENVGTAVAAVMAPDQQNGQYPKSVLGTLVSWWEPFLATTRQGPNYNAAAAAWLRTLLYDTLTFTLTAFATDVLKGKGSIGHAVRTRMLRAVAEPRPTF